MRPLIQLLFSFQGRIGRQTFWLASFGLAFANLIVLGCIIGLARSREQTLILAYLWLPVCWWMAIAVQAKRWHDRGKSGWLVLVNLIPVVGFGWSVVELGFFDGTIGPNRYGADPREPAEDGTENSGYARLAQATRLELQGRTAEALAAYEAIATRYAHTAAGPDARRSAVHLREKVG